MTEHNADCIGPHDKAIHDLIDCGYSSSANGLPCCF